jgi:hypothetical protein
MKSPNLQFQVLILFPTPCIYICACVKIQISRRRGCPQEREIVRHGSWSSAILSAILKLGEERGKSRHFVSKRGRGGAPSLEERGKRGMVGPIGGAGDSGGSWSGDRSGGGIKSGGEVVVCDLGSAKIYY